MQRRRLHDDDVAADKIIVIALVTLLTVSVISVIAYVNVDSEDDAKESKSMDWIDPVVEIEDENHSHTDLLAHRLQTENLSLIHI